MGVRRGRELPPAVQHYSNRCGFHTQLSLSIPLCYTPPPLSHHLLNFSLFSLPLSAPATPLSSLFGFVWATKARISNIMCLHYTKSILKLVRFIVAYHHPPPLLLSPYTHTLTHACVAWHCAWIQLHNLLLWLTHKLEATWAAAAAAAEKRGKEYMRREGGRLVEGAAVRQHLCARPSMQ